MAFTKCYMNEMFGTLLVLSALLSTTSAVDCYGKSFRCVNSTHFMICVDLGGGVSQAIQDFYIACPPPTVCQGNNHFECEFPAPPTPDTILNNAINETTLPWEEIVTVSSLNNTNKEFSENYMDTTVEKGTTTAIEYSVTTDTTVDVTSKTMPDIYINNELNVTEVAATILAETTTTPVEITPHTLSEVNVVTQTTENIPTTGIESVAQSAAETINLTNTQIVDAGAENISLTINNTQTTTENKVITETVTEQPAPITTEQIIQITTSDPLEQEPSSLYTDLPPQVINLFQNVSLTNNTVLKESPVMNENIQAIEKTKIFSLDEGTKNNKDLIPISEKANVIQPDNIFKNVEITSTVESIVEITTASIEHLTIIPSDKISTDVYHGSTASSSDNKLKPYPSGLHKDTPAPNKLEGSIQSKVISEKQQNKTSQMNKIQHALNEIKHTIGEWALAPNKENLSTTAYNDVFPELAVTTELPFVNDVEANANMTNKNIIDNIPITDYTNAQNNKVTTTLDRIGATETFGNDSSFDQPITINEGQLTKESTQNVVTENFDFVTNANMTTTNVIDNKPITDYYEVTTTLDGIVATETFGNDSSFDQPTTINEGQLTKESTQNVVTENIDFVTNANMMNKNVIDNKPITDYYEVTTTLDGIVATETFGNDSSLDQPTTINEGQLTKESTPSIVTENFDFVPNANMTNTNVIDNKPITDYYEVTTTLDGIVATKTFGIDSSSDQPTTINEGQLTKESTQNVVTENFDFVTNANMMNTNVIDNKPITDYYEVITTLDGIVATETFGNDSSLDQPTTINEGQLTKESTPSIVTENFDFVTNANMTNTNVIDNKPITDYYEVTTYLDGIVATKTFGIDSSSDQPTTISEGQLIKVSTQNVVTENFDFVTTEAGYTTIPNSNVQSVTTEVPFVMTKSQNSVDSELGGVFIIENVETTASTEQLTTTSQQSLIIGTTKSFVTENNFIPTNEAINQGIMSTEAINEPTKLLNPQPMMTDDEVPSFVTNIQNFEGTTLDPALKVNEETIATDTPAIITAQPMVTKDQHTKRQKLITQNLDKTELNIRFITDNIEDTASTEQPTTVYEESLTVDTNQNVVAKNDFIPTSKTVYQGIVSVEATYETTTMTNLHSTKTIMTKQFDDKKIDSASIVEFGTSTEHIKTINEETRTTNTPDIVNAKPMMTEVPSPGTGTQNSAGVKLDEEFINKTTENIGSIKRPNTIHEQSLIVDTTQNDAVVNIVLPTSEAVNRGIMSTADIHESSSIINLQPVTTEASTLVTVTQNSENTKQDAAFIIKDIEFRANIGITDTSANFAAEKITIPTNEVVHTLINNTQTTTTELNTTTEALLLTMTVQNPITKHTSKDVAVNTQIEENSATAEKAITINKGTSTTNTEQNLASENSVTPTRQAVNLDITTRDTLYTLTTISNDHQISVAAQQKSNKAQVITTPTSVTITDKVLNSETVGNNVGTTQSAAIKEESVTTDTAQNVASIIIPKSQTGKENKTVKKDVNVAIIVSEMSNAQPTPKDNKDNKVPLPSFEHTASITETGSTSVVTSKPDLLSLQQKKQQLSENNLVPGSGRENVVKRTSDTYDLTSTNAIELNFNMEPTMTSIKRDTVIIGKGSNPMDLTASSVQFVNKNDHTILNTALSNDENLKTNIDQNGYANQDNFKIGTKISSNQFISGINVPENLPSLQYITHGISKQNSNNMDLSIYQAPEKESNYISNQAIMSQHGKSETMLVTNDVNSNPLESYLIDKSNQSIESARKSSVINLNVEENDVDTALPDIAFVSQQPIQSILPASSSTSDGPNNREQSTTGTKISTQISTNGLLENITKVNSEPEVDTLPAPESKMIAKEDSITLRTSTQTSTSGILADVSSSTTVPTGTTVADTTSAFFRPGSKSTVEEAGNNLGDLGSNANVFPDKIESEYPKNSNDPIPPSQSVIYQYKLTTNSQDFSETTSTKGDTITEKVNVSRKPLMLNVLPVPINNVGLRSPVKNIPVIADLTTQAQNGNIIQITESYKSVTFNPALTNTGTHAGINGVDITITPTLRNPTLKLQAGVTDKGNASPRSPTFGDSAIVGNLATNNDVTIFSTLSDATSNSPTEVIDRADVSLQQPQLIELRPVEKTSANMPYANIPPNIEQEENKNIQNGPSPILTDMPMGVTLESYPEIKNLIPKSNSNVPEDSIANTVYQEKNFTVITDLKYNPQNGSETKSEPQQNNSPTNHALSTQTQKTYASSTVRVPSQSVTQKVIPRIKNITKPVTNDTNAFNCIKGIRGRYSDKDDCRKFYICLGIDRPIVGNCPENTVFSDVKKLCTKNLSHCIRQNEFKCPSAGRFSDFMKDNVYYICVSHNNHLYKFKFQCQKGYILNKTIVKCIETKEIESNESVSISSSDSSRQTGSTSAVSSSTNSKSISSSTTSNTSNGGDNISKSEDSSKTKKSNEAEETPEQPEETKKKDDEEEVFKCKKEGKFPIRNECRRFYLCKKKGSQYRRKVKKCESGSVFHKDKKKCVDDDDYEC